MVFTPIHRRSNVGESDLDFVEQARIGHPQLPEEDAYIVERVLRYSQQFERPVRVFILNGRTGVFASKLITAVPEIELVVQERAAAAVAKLNSRFADSSVTVFTGAYDEWNEPVDIFISKGIHHHAPRAYLDQVKRVLSPEGILILSDEFCPEYCNGKYAERILNADKIYLAGGYVLTDAQEIETYEQTGQISDIAKEIERLRQQALWTWYRYVVDYAMERDCLKVAIEELRAAFEDLITSSGSEHKVSPLIVEREMELRGFEQRSKQSIAPEQPVEYQSFFTYEYVVKA
jgi:SAM-dependent methyltransferase